MNHFVSNDDLRKSLTSLKKEIQLVASSFMHCFVFTIAWQYPQLLELIMINYHHQILVYSCDIRLHYLMCINMLCTIFSRTFCG